MADAPQWPKGSDKLEPEEKSVLLWIAAVVGVIVLLAAVATFFAERQQRKHRERIYTECREDGKPSYYCEALAREVTR